MARVTQTARAQLDLDEIWLHIAPDNIDAADRLIDTLVLAAEGLLRQPLMGRARPELAADLRSWPVARYLLFYRPTPEGIEVVRVLHSARDVPSIGDGGGFEAG